MNPDHYHLEFYEDDSGTMPVLTWLNRLESADRVKHDAIIYGPQVILAREGVGVLTDVTHSSTPSGGWTLVPTPLT